MLTFNVNTKRQRRPNVRLGEVGDLPAAFACGMSHRIKENLGQKRWRSNFNNIIDSESNQFPGFCGQSASEFTNLDHDASPRFSEDMQQNRENKDPNSSKSARESADLVEINASKPKVNFGIVTKKCRLMNRHRRETYNLLYGPWSSDISTLINRKDEQAYDWNDVDGFINNAGNINGSKNFTDDESSATSKAACEVEDSEPNFNVQMQRSSDEFRADDDSLKDSGAFTQSGNGGNKTVRNDDVDTVRTWLEELGFGRYANLFEVHEVDEESLPLLTVDDLKEMGILAVGARRKLFTLIQQLRKDE